MLTPSLEDLLAQDLPPAARVLQSFDPMALRNSICACSALQFAASEGFKFAITGDAADELLGGYSFTHRLEEEDWAKQRAAMVNNMHFDAIPLGEAVGIKVSSPYLDEQFVGFAMSLRKPDCIGPVRLRPHPNASEDAEPTVAGKLPLRFGFPSNSSALRRKDPAEVGCGTTALGSAPWLNREGYFDSRISDSDYARSAAVALDKHGVKLRDKEHLAYFRVFEESFGANGSLVVPGKPRPNDDPCPACGFALAAEEATFCLTCGHYDAALAQRKTAAATPS